MVGHSIPEVSQTVDFENKNKIFEIKNLKLLDNAASNVNFSMYEGEILRVAWVDGSGQLELEEMTMGLRDFKEGEIYYKEKLISNITLNRT